MLNSMGFEWRDKGRTRGKYGTRERRSMTVTSRIHFQLKFQTKIGIRERRHTKRYSGALPDTGMVVFIQHWEVG